MRDLRYITEREKQASKKQFFICDIVKRLWCKLIILKDYNFNNNEKSLSEIWFIYM